MTPRQTICAFTMAALAGLAPLGAAAETGYGWLECLAGERAAPTMVTTPPQLFRYDMPTGVDGVIPPEEMAEIPAMLEYMTSEERAYVVELQTQDQVARAEYFEPQVARQWGPDFLDRVARTLNMNCTLSPPKAPGPFATLNEAQKVRDSANEGLMLFLRELDGTVLQVNEIPFSAE